MLPGRARVRRFVDTITHREIGPTQALSTANINYVRIRRRDREGSYGAGRLVIKYRMLCAAKVRRLPDSPVIRSHVEDIRLNGNASHRTGTTAAKRTDQPPVEFLVHRRIVLCGKRERKKSYAKRGEHNPKKTLVHSLS